MMNNENNMVPSDVDNRLDGEEKSNLLSHLNTKYPLGEYSGKYLLSTEYLNPDRRIVYSITRALDRNEGYCPCNQKDIPKEDTKCPCKKWREEQICCCNLYIK